MSDFSDQAQYRAFAAAVRRQPRRAPAPAATPGLAALGRYLHLSMEPQPAPEPHPESMEVVAA